MEVFVETAAFTPLRHNRKIVFCHVAHEQQDVDMSGFPVASKKTTGHRNSDASSNTNSCRATGVHMTGMILKGQFTQKWKCDVYLLTLAGHPRCR